MAKNKLILLALAASFGFGFAFNSILTDKTKMHPTMKRVTGLGGIFFKCKDTKAVSEWYKNHLGIDAGQYGASFEWLEAEDPAKKGLTQWTPFSDQTKYFEPSSKEFMINYRVDDLEALVAALKSEGVTILDEIASYDYGKFVHILDPEGNKIELWEPAG
jgi:predicted enzyme related to lactoylglutathione lyase